MTDLLAKAIDTDRSNFQLGNETYVIAGATFVRNTDTPNIYDSNHATSVIAQTPNEIDELLAAMERDFRHSGHRRFDVDFRTPPEFVARLALEGGYERDDGLLLLLEGDLIGEAMPCEIRPVESDADWEAFWELMWLDWAEHHERQKRTPKEDIARQMLASKRAKQPPVQYWMAYEGERPVGFFNSWAGTNGVGQVEDLFVHPEWRKRGYATSLIHHCVADARVKGAGAIVIAADPTDTPKNIYARMGWRPVAVLSKMQKLLVKPD